MKLFNVSLPPSTSMTLPSSLLVGTVSHCLSLSLPNPSLSFSSLPFPSYLLYLLCLWLFICLLICVYSWCVGLVLGVNGVWPFPCFPLYLTSLFPGMSNAFVTSTPVKLVIEFLYHFYSSVLCPFCFEGRRLTWTRTTMRLFCSTALNTSLPISLNLSHTHVSSLSLSVYQDCGDCPHL